MKRLLFLAVLGLSSCTATKDVTVGNLVDWSGAEVFSNTLSIDQMITEADLMQAFCETNQRGFHCL